MGTMGVNDWNTCFIVRLDEKMVALKLRSPQAKRDYDG